MVRAKVGEERREQILSAFELCVIRDGLAKTTLQKVADQSGLPRSLVRYFIGNRADMVALLIDRMIERGESSMAQFAKAKGALGVHGLIDALFDHVFANDTSNSIVGELWKLSETDSAVRQRLSAMYQRIVTIFSDQMKIEGLGSDDATRDQIAFDLLCLAYGHASFRILFASTSSEDSPLPSAKAQAHRMLERLNPAGELS